VDALQWHFFEAARYLVEETRTGRCVRRPFRPPICKRGYARSLCAQNVSVWSHACSAQTASNCV
jgi:hypothetical protein